MYDEFFSKAHELTQEGIPFATATVVRAEKPTSGKPGDKAIITIDGVMHGWIGGSCAQPTVVKEALKAMQEDEGRLIRLSTESEVQENRDGLMDLPMTCFSGGTLEIYIEPQQPRPRLLIIGTLPVAQALAHLGKAMNYHVIAVDPDNDGVGMEHAHEVVTELDALSSLITPLTYAVVATHGTYDEVAVESILNTNVAYVGLVASRRRAESVLNYLEAQGMTESDLTPLKAPAGLDILARRGDEIALSIMAEIVQKRRSIEQLNWALFSTDKAPPADAGPSEVVCCGCSAALDTELSAATAIDPICQMEVNVDQAKFISEFEGQMVYFCCAGCKQKFDAEPLAYPLVASLTNATSASPEPYHTPVTPVQPSPAT